jgi:hypothetical protein
MDLGLYDNRPAQLFSDLAGLLGATGDPSSGDGNAGLGHDLFGLILMDFHSAISITKAG